METKNNTCEIPEAAFVYRIEMPLRDYFAAHAPIANFIAPAWDVSQEVLEKNAEFAYRWADAMLKAKNK